MPLHSLDHVNIQTTNLDEMKSFYQEILQLRVGWRPSFKSDGAWLYCNEKAVIHLVEITSPVNVVGIQIEHFAFLGKDLRQFMKTLKRTNTIYNVTIVPDTEAYQVNIHDPDGNHIEIQFAKTVDAMLDDIA